MISFLLYIGKVSLCMLIAYLPYFLFMRRISFFSANRIWLLFTLILSFVIPLIKIPVPHVPFAFPNYMLNEWMDEGTVAFANNTLPLKPALPGIDWNSILLFIYLPVSLLLFLRFSKSLYSLYKAFRRSVKEKHDKMLVLVSENQHLPFSFFRFVFLGRSDFENENNHLILIHEQAHYQCLHSLDILLLEILQWIFWMNPMLIIYKRELRLQHEYQVDKIVLQKTNDYSGYLYSLAKVVSNGLYAGISNGFYCSTLKKRIQMIGNINSKRKSALLYLLILPFTALMILAFTRAETIKFFSIIAPIPIIYQQPHNVPCIVPIDESKAKLVAGWGNRIHPIYKIKMLHSGIDWQAPIGTEIYAAADGIVVESDSTNEQGFGHTILIQHGESLNTFYAHMGRIIVAKGDKVKMGQIIGYVGNTGRSTGSHLHYEVRKNREPIDPSKYFVSKVISEPSDTAR